jgi:hypothetical protein
VAELRVLAQGEWLHIDGSRGEHGSAEVSEALQALERDAIVELDPERGARLR